MNKVDSTYLNELLLTINVGTWDWDLATGKVDYSPAWARLLGYQVDELPQVVDTWEKLVLPQDIDYANQQIELHLSGERPVYEAEFRMICKDGSIIWAQDKGRVTEYGTDGTPVRFVGVLQNVTRLKDAELQLRESQESLDLAVAVAELGTWDWDIVGNTIHYNDEYLRLLGYSQSDKDGSIEEWEAMNHPEDLPRSQAMLEDYLSGKSQSYTCEIRMKHRDGYYIWTRDVGKIVAWDADGNPTRLIGGHLNIDELKRSEERLTQVLKYMENYNQQLEQEVAARTGELLEQDKMLWTVNQISRRLLTFRPGDDFGSLVQDCLQQLGESINRNRVYIWKDHETPDRTPHCTQIYEWVRSVVPIQGIKEFECIPYADLPNFAIAIDSDKCLNSLIRNLSASERAILEPQGIKTILIAPIAINGKRWGFIGVDNCDDEQLFSSSEETMLLMSGSLLANTIDKMDTEAQLHEMEERTQLMLDATPLCCNLWSPDHRNMSCNEEAVRLFELSSQEEYLQRFFELSPERQPCGRLSNELALEYLDKAFAEGYYRFEWLHQKVDGTPIPAEITLVRVKYKDGYIVAGYTRDLREFKTILAQLQAQEDDLRLARDEALLSSKAKSNFLANMSHEIRTPMNAITGLAEIILRESTESATVEHAKGIKTASSNLLNIINDILDISKIESGKLEIYQSEYELASLLNDVITVARIRLGSKPLMFITDIDSHLPEKLVGDEIRIKQILINLLSNAIKFTSEGYLALRVTGGVQGDRAVLRFAVEDSGAGIKQEDLERLFAEFERVNTTKNRTIEGTGLGLAISKQLCEMMDGQIEVHSVFGTGSVFTAVIPQQCLSAARMSQVDGKKTVLLYEPRDRYRNSIAQSLENLGCRCIPCANQSDLYDNITAKTHDYLLTPALHLSKVKQVVHKNRLSVPIAAIASYGEAVDDAEVYTMQFPVSCLQLANLLNHHPGDGNFFRNQDSMPHFVAPTARVLVVDDNSVNLSVAAGLMAPYQFAIDTAINGVEAVRMVGNAKYDLVFMDHMMPEMDGIDATVAIRQMQGDYYKNLPIVALTANALVGTREMFIREGMNDFLAKPIEVNKLAHILAKWLPQSKLVATQPKNPKSASAETAVLRIEGVNTAQGVLYVGGNMDNYLQILTAYYADGQQKCSTLVQHFSKKDLRAFGTEIHAVKSTSATIGALRVSSLAAKLEDAARNGELEYIDNNIDPFLTEYQQVLEAIRPVLPAQLSEEQQANSQNSKPGGDPLTLSKLLNELREAAEFARIAKVEQILGDLQGFAWAQEVTAGLQALREYVAVFDYDGVLTCVEQLQQDL